MAEVIRIAESASEAATPALPQNVEAEAALLGALMIDNRLVEDVQLKLKPHHFFEPLHGRIYEAILRLTDSNRIANPGDAEAAVRGGRGDEGSRRPGLSRPADRVGRGGDRRPRLRRHRSTISRCSAPSSASAASSWKARSIRVRTLPPSLRSSAPRPSCTRSPRKAAPKARPRASAKPTKEALAAGREGAQQRRPSVGHHHRPRRPQRARSAAFTSPT